MFDEVIVKIEEDDTSNSQTNEIASQRHNQEKQSLQPNQSTDQSHVINPGIAIRTEAKEIPYQCEMCLKRYARGGY